MKKVSHVKYDLLDLSCYKKSKNLNKLELLNTDRLKFKISKPNLLVQNKIQRCNRWNFVLITNVN